MSNALSMVLFSANPTVSIFDRCARRPLLSETIDRARKVIQNDWPLTSLRFNMRCTDKFLILTRRVIPKVNRPVRGVSKAGRAAVVLRPRCSRRSCRTTSTTGPGARGGGDGR